MRHMLFEAGIEAMPLAARMRPLHLDEVVGQDHLIGKGKPLRRAIESDKIGSLVLYGPPGSGKTTIAEVIANMTSSKFVRLNAVYSGVADIRRVISAARDDLAMRSEKTVVFIDEIHRFNKAQQDALLPAVEDGAICLIGATTENPFFDIVAPLVSRSRIFMLKPINEQALVSLLLRAATDSERGLGGLGLEFAPEAMAYIAKHAGGDARIALNVLEMASIVADSGKVDVEAVSDILGRTMLKYDMQGDIHYDVISAFIKSMRGSDPDAALHYLARMIESGEDPRFIARRILIHASEDVGMADPTALSVAAAAAFAVEHVGLPEARITLAQATIHIATAPKSNSVVMAIDAAIADLKDKPLGHVPAHLASGGYAGAERIGKAVGYKYPHDYPGGWVQQQYLPDEFVGAKYYRPPDQTRLEASRTKVKALVVIGTRYVAMEVADSQSGMPLPWTYAKPGESSLEAFGRIMERIGAKPVKAPEIRDVSDSFSSAKVRQTTITYRCEASLDDSAIPEGLRMADLG